MSGNTSNAALTIVVGPYTIQLHSTEFDSSLYFGISEGDFIRHLGSALNTSLLHGTKDGGVSNPEYYTLGHNVTPAFNFIAFELQEAFNKQEVTLSVRNKRTNKELIWAEQMTIPQALLAVQNYFADLPKEVRRIPEPRVPSDLERHQAEYDEALQRTLPYRAAAAASAVASGARATANAASAVAAGAGEVATTVYQNLPTGSQVQCAVYSGLLAVAYPVAWAAYGAQRLTSAVTSAIATHAGQQEQGQGRE